MSSSSSSTPSYTPASYSADASGYFTGRPRVNPLNIQESEDRSSSESGHETSSARNPFEEPRASPTIIIREPNHRGPRTIQTARKSVPIPRRVSLRTNQTEAPGPSRVAADVPIGQVPGATWAGEQHLRAMTTELHSLQVRVTHQGRVMAELVELHHLLTNISAQARESARAARRTAMRAALACMVGGIVCFLMVLTILASVYLGRF